MNGNRDGTGRRIDVAPGLIDRQIVNADGDMLGKVDDVELVVPPDGSAPVVTALLCGPLALGPRLGGRLGQWIQAVGGRLRPEADPRPVRLDFGLVTELGTRATVAVPDPAAVGMDRSEGWVREHVIGRIPGAGQ